MFSTVALDGPDCLQGDYTLAGRSDVVPLAIGAAGWWWPGSRPEQAVTAVAAALGLTGTAASFYDFRNPPASGLFIQWLSG